MKKIHSKKKITTTASRRSILIGVGLVFLVYFLLAIRIISPSIGETQISSEYCTFLTDLAERSSCFYRLATETKNPDFCKEMDISAGQPLFPFVDCLKYTNGLHLNYCEAVPEPTRSSCYFALAVGLEDLGLCSKSDDQVLCETITKVRSVKIFNMNKKGHKVITTQECEKITLDKHYLYGNDRDECLYIAALAENNISTCNSIKDEIRQADCIFELAITEENCRALSDENSWPHNSYQNNCFFRIAIKTKNPEMCFKIGDNGLDGIVDRCHTFATEQTS